MLTLTKQQFKKALQETILCTPGKKATYKNKKPNQEELNQKWKLKKR